MLNYSKLPHSLKEAPQKYSTKSLMISASYVQKNTVKRKKYEFCLITVLIGSIPAVGWQKKFVEIDTLGEYKRG